MNKKLEAWKIDQDGQKVVTFCNNLKGSGDYKGKPIKLRPWQESILRKLFGTKNKLGARQYRTLFMALPRKQGKTSLIACIVLYLLIASGKKGQVILSVSGCQEQAKQIYEYMADAISEDPYLENRLIVYKNTCKIVDNVTGNYFHAIPADKEGRRKMGKNVSVAIFDEGAFWSDEYFHNSITSSMGTRSDPLKIYISTAGFDVNTWFYREWQYALDVRDGKIKDNTYLPVIYAADPSDDPFSLKTWKKAMPALGDFCSVATIKEEFERAKHDPAKLNYYKAVYLNLWSQALTTWLDQGLWDKCKGNFTDDDLKTWKCIGGLDLGIVHDLSSLALVFSKDGRYRVKSYTWLPKEGIDQRSLDDKAPYTQWAKDGWLTLTEGSSANNASIKADIVRLAKQYNIATVYADQYNAYDLKSQLVEEQVACDFYSQGIAALTYPAKKLQAAILDGQIEHDGNPLLRWSIGNVAVRTDENENIKPVKRDGKDGRCRIDPVMALIMALGATLDGEMQARQRPSVYMGRGILVL